MTVGINTSYGNSGNSEQPWTKADSLRLSEQSKRLDLLTIIIDTEAKVVRILFEDTLYKDVWTFRVDNPSKSFRTHANLAGHAIAEAQDHTLPLQEGQINMLFSLSREDCEDVCSIIRDMIKETPIEKLTALMILQNERIRKVLQVSPIQH